MDKPRDFDQRQVDEYSSRPRARLSAIPIGEQAAEDLTSAHMDRPTIAIFGKPDDPQSLAAAEAVQAEGGSAAVVPVALEERQAPEVAFGRGGLRWGGVDFSSVESMYIRAMAPNTLPFLPPVLNATSQSEWRTRYVREQEYQSFAYSFFEELRAQGKLVVNPFTAYTHHNAKAQFYERLRAEGFDVPRTLTTNAPEQARAFARAVGEVVIKPGLGVGSTRKLRADQLEGLEACARCPVMLQEFIQGQILRLHVVGGTVVLALKILGEAIDSRTETRGFEYYPLPEAQAQQVVRANQALGLHFAAWDAFATPDGRLVLLDCNPGPYVMWIGPEFVRAVFFQLARYLVAYARTHSGAEAAKLVSPWRPRA